ncbi:hypothetical protein LTR36_006771 [Oleoguttula mirabilis]|uniref:Uncharacterized protein n=1 Tax=Oleoguttula mirabilis TaxID=1507867 RepID=A0AAV9JCL6_9PEZI|nr:hypothetical protein LTR36_006771 [Oleoguttula mirabilis]
MTSAAKTSASTSAVSTTSAALVIAEKDLKIAHLTNSITGLSLTRAFAFLVLIGAAIGCYLHRHKVARYRARGAAFDTQFHARNSVEADAAVAKPKHAFFGSAKKYDEHGVEMI